MKIVLVSFFACLITIMNCMEPEELAVALRNNNMSEIENLERSEELIKAITDEIQRLKSIEEEIVVSAS